MEKNTVKKRISHAFEKDVYLLGVNDESRTMWLEAPTWNCDWYWGFGYVEVYTNKINPANARDIISHSHISGMVGKQEYYNEEKNCFCLSSGYIHNLYDAKELVHTTFSEKEGWNLSELFKQFYLLQNMAEFAHKEKPSCHITTSPVDHGSMLNWYNKINNIMIPKITAEIMRILTP